MAPNRSNGVKHKVVNSNQRIGVVARHSPALEVLRTSGPSVIRMNGSDFTSTRLHPNRLGSRVQEEIRTIRPSNGCPISARESCSVRAQHLLHTELHSRPSKHLQTDQAWEQSSYRSSNACTLTKYSHHGGGGVSDLKNKDNTGAYQSIRETSVTVGKSLRRTTTGRGESVYNRGGRSAGSTNTRGDVSFGNTNIEAGKSFKGRALDGVDSQQTVVMRTQKYEEEYRRLCFNIGDRHNRWFFNFEYRHQKRCKCNNCETDDGGSPLVAVARILGWCFDWVGGK